MNNNPTPLTVSLFLEHPHVRVAGLPSFCHISTPLPAFYLEPVLVFVLVLHSAFHSLRTRNDCRQSYNFRSYSQKQPITLNHTQDTQGRECHTKYLLPSYTP